MKRSIITAIALGMALLSLTDGAYAQPCGLDRKCTTSSQPEVPVPEVCFYTGTNFKGLHFCEAGMRTVATVPAQWRNKIKSITVSEQAEVRVCPAFTLQGNCSVFDRDIKELAPGLFKHVYSYQTMREY